MKCDEITPRVRDWLGNGRSPRILHLFDEVCNLVDEQGEIISLATPRIGSGPFTMILAGDFRPRLDLHWPVQVDYAARSLTIGSLVVDFSQASVWQPRPQWRKLQAISLSQLAPPSKLTAVIEKNLTKLLSGIVTEDVTAVQRGAYGLAGRGRGLTPTGDDVLMGVLYGLWVWQPRRAWLDLIAATAVPRTTTLSANFLRAAAAGEATFHWHELVNGRAHAPAQIQAIGHSSGVEAWAGFMRAGMALTRKRAVAS